MNNVIDKVEFFQKRRELVQASQDMNTQIGSKLSVFEREFVQAIIQYQQNSHKGLIDEN